MLKKYTQKANRHNFTACICLSVMDGDRERRGGEKEMRRGEKKKRTEEEDRRGEERGREQPQQDQLSFLIS